MPKPTGRPAGRPKGHKLSAESRAAISEGMRRAWARKRAESNGPVIHKR